MKALHRHKQLRCTEVSLLWDIYSIYSLPDIL